MAAEGLPIENACRVVGVSVSGYYSWLDRPPSAKAIRHAWLTELIVKIHTDSKAAYGARRVHAELTLGHGITVGHETVAMLMRRAGLQGLSGRPRYRKVPNMPTASDLVDRNFSRSEPDRLWVTDITEHPTREGKVYCAVVLDVYSRRVVGWSIDSRPAATLVTSALGMAIDNRQPVDGETIIHSDHGTQFTSWAFTNAPSTRVCCRRWDQSATATTMPSLNRSGAACRSSCSTRVGGGPGSNSPTRSSNTSRPGTIDNADTQHSA